MADGTGKKHQGSWLNLAHQLTTATFTDAMDHTNTFDLEGPPPSRNKVLSAITSMASSTGWMRWTSPDDFPAKTFAFHPHGVEYARITFVQPRVK